MTQLEQLQRLLDSLVAAGAPGAAAWVQVAGRHRRPAAGRPRGQATPKLPAGYRLVVLQHGPRHQGGRRAVAAEELRRRGGPSRPLGGFDALYSQVTTTTTTKNWRDYISERDAILVEELLDPELARFGYLSTVR